MDEKKRPVLEYKPESEASESGKWLDYVIQIVVHIVLVVAVLGLVIYFWLSRIGS